MHIPGGSRPSKLAFKPAHYLMLMPALLLLCAAPHLQEFAHPVLEGADPESGIDEEYRMLTSDKVCENGKCCSGSGPVLARHRAGVLRAKAGAWESMS